MSLRARSACRWPLGGIRSLRLQRLVDVEVGQADLGIGAAERVAEHARQLDERPGRQPRPPAQPDPSRASSGCVAVGVEDAEAPSTARRHRAGSALMSSVVAGEARAGLLAGRRVSSPAMSYTMS